MVSSFLRKQEPTAGQRGAGSPLFKCGRAKEFRFQCGSSPPPQTRGPTLHQFPTQPTPRISVGAARGPHTPRCKAASRNAAPKHKQKGAVRQPPHAHAQYRIEPYSLLIIHADDMPQLRLLRLQILQVLLRLLHRRRYPLHNVQPVTRQSRYLPWIIRQQP